MKLKIRSLARCHEQFAERAEYSVDFISFVERGLNAPSIEGCQCIADALQVSLSELFDFAPLPKEKAKCAKEATRARKKAKG